MTVASEITRIEGNIAAAYTAASAKGATLPATENSDNLATCISSISSGSSGKYKLFDTVYDDNDDEVGMVSGFIKVGNTEYAVVCLGKDNRPSSSLELFTGDSYGCDNTVTNEYHNIWEIKETATTMCNTILSTLSEGTTPAITACRNLSFTIDGVTYYGQLPSVPEAVDIMKNAYNLGLTFDDAILTSSVFYDQDQSRTYNSIIFMYGVENEYEYSHSAHQVIPVLEIPNT